MTDGIYRTIMKKADGVFAARAEGSEKAGTAEKVGTALRRWLGSRRNRILVAILAGMLAASGVSGDLSALSRQEPSPSLTAWWGSLYPKFCYAETPDAPSGAERSTRPRKLSFRLAKASD